MSPTVLALSSVLGILLVIILGPLIPALITYKIFPKDPIGINGPLGRLKINATGAFAGYLITLILLFPMIRHFKLIPDFEALVKHFSAREDGPWRVKARISFFEDGKKIHLPNDSSKHLQLRLTPDALEKDINNIVFLTYYKDKIREPWVNIEYEGQSFAGFTKRLTKEDADDSTLKFFPDDNLIVLNAILERTSQKYDPGVENYYISQESRKDTGQALKK